MDCSKLIRYGISIRFERPGAFERARSKKIKMKNYVVIIIIIHELLFLHREVKEKAFEVWVGGFVSRASETFQTAIASLTIKIKSVCC